MALFILRGLFIILSTCIALVYVLPLQEEATFNFSQVIVLVGAALAISCSLVIYDTLNKRKRLAAFSGVFLGLLAGLLIAFALGIVVELFGRIIPAPKYVTNESWDIILRGVKVFIGVMSSYICISVVLQTKDDFRFIIPYVEFSKQIRGSRPILLDTSVIIDGRIADLIKTKILQGHLIAPKFVLLELQTIADSADKLKRARGRRGLEILQELQNTQIVPITIDDSEVEGTGVDQKLISLAQTMPARIMTNDYNLNKIATLRGLEVININDVAKSLKPVALPGEIMNIKIVKHGESPTQGVGYLEDGTMVVVEHAHNMLEKRLDVIVTSTLQTSAGRMIFGRNAAVEDDTNQSASASHHSARPSRRSS